VVDDRPVLSICIPSYNLEEWTAAAVDSALAVGSPDEVEVVVVDDGSTDRTVETLEQFAGAPNLKVHQPEHLGMVPNFNRAVRATSGRWFTVLGADDELSPDYYEHLRPHVDRTDRAAISQVAMMQWANGESAFGPTIERTFDAGQIALMLGGAMCISTTAVRRDLFEEVGGFASDVGTVFDLDLFVRICQVSGLPIQALADVGGRYHPLRGGTWTNQQTSGEGAEVLLEWLDRRAAEMDRELEPQVRAALGARARLAGRFALTKGDRNAARRSLTVAVTCSTGVSRLANRAALAGTYAPTPVVRGAYEAYRRATETPEPPSGELPAITRYDVDRSEMLPFVPTSARTVLDVGCAAGWFGAALRDRDPSLEVTGIEPDPVASAHAATVLDRVVAGVFPDEADKAARPGGYDVIVFNDVLEHMVDPRAALDAARPLLSSSGVVVASIPNVRHVSVTGPLVSRGEWEYKSVGVLDSTHLRFFTETSVRQLFADAGWKITTCAPINRCARIANPETPRWVSALGKLTGGRSDPFFVLQYAIVASPATPNTRSRPG